jgi:hypothetical protein
MSGALQMQMQNCYDVNRKEKFCPSRRAKIGFLASGRFWRKAAVRYVNA